MTTRKLISIVCPVYNEQECIPIFYERLRSTLEPLCEIYDFEVIFTNNRSSDRSLELIQNIRLSDPRVQVLTFSRNFGYQPSILAGLRHAAGDAIVCIDVDCEDPPELIPRFVEEWERGFDVVYGDRKKRTENLLVQWARMVFYRLNRLLADTEIVLDMGDFLLLSRRVRDLMLANRTTFPFLRTEAAYVGFDRRAIAYRRQARVRGRTHFRFIALMKFAIGGILSSSTFPLRAVAFLFPPVFVAAAALAFLDLIEGSQRAFHALVALALLYIVLACACLAIYVARTYKNGVARPIFIVDWDQSALNGDHARWTTDTIQDAAREESVEAVWRRRL